MTATVERGVVIGSSRVSIDDLSIDGRFQHAALLVDEGGVLTARRVRIRGAELGTPELAGLSILSRQRQDVTDLDLAGSYFEAIRLAEGANLSAQRVLINHGWVSAGILADTPLADTRGASVAIDHLRVRGNGMRAIGLNRAQRLRLSHFVLERGPAVGIHSGMASPFVALEEGDLELARAVQLPTASPLVVITALVGERVRFLPLPGTIRIGDVSLPP